MHLQGRVFTRQQRFASLPAELQDETNALADYLTHRQDEIFAKHHTLSLKSVYGVRAQHLLQAIDKWIRRSHPADTTHATGNSPVAAPEERVPMATCVASAGGHRPHGEHVPHDDHERVRPVASAGGRSEHGDKSFGHVPHYENEPKMPVASAGGHSEHGDKSWGHVPHYEHEQKHPVASAGGHNQANSGHVAHRALEVASPHAMTLFKALLLKGFITRHKEDKHASSSGTEDLTFDENELLVTLSKFVADEATQSTTSVWDLVDGAVFADTVKRKAGLLEPLTHGKEVYVMVNARTKTLTLFKTDLSRKPILEFDATSLQVAFDSTRYDYGVKVWTSDGVTELLNAGSQPESDALIHALLAVGATHDAGHFVGDATDVTHPLDPASNQEAGGTGNKDTISGVVGQEEHGAAYKSDHAATVPTAP